MTNPPAAAIILLADDDAEDRQLAGEALSAAFTSTLHTVSDGVELMDYLQRRGGYSDPIMSPRPGVILLDLSMPKKDGREALAEIKLDPELRKIPVIVLTTSSADEDIRRSYDLGASSYVTKPASFAGLTDVMRGIGHYWFEIVELPA